MSAEDFAIVREALYALAGTRSAPVFEENAALDRLELDHRTKRERIVRLEARSAEQDARWQEMDHPYNKAEVDALHARIAEVERERDAYHASAPPGVLEHVNLIRRAEAAEARAERYAAALQLIANRTHPATYLGRRDDGTEMYGGSDDAARFALTALTEQPPVENTDFEWKMQEC